MIEMQDAGCFALVIEKVPAELAARLTSELLIPVIGIAAGPDCDGQILVLHDMLGMFEPPGYKFVKRYAEIGAAIRDAVSAYTDDVRAGRFPAEEHTFHTPPKQADSQ